MLFRSVALTKELVTEPANIIYPESFVERCKHLAELGVEISVLDDKDMAALGMGALLGVAQGSRRPARLLVMKWDGTGGSQERPVALVGKGVTFDTGGISIKPAAGMEDMKWDMGGAGAVAGAAIEEGITREDGIEITVKLDNGTLIAIVQEATDKFTPGERVRLIESNGNTRVSH